EIDSDQIKEGETPINTIEGASLSVYEPNTLTTGTAQIQIGEAFTDAPNVAKQVRSVDGKQKLISPINAMKVYKGVSFEGNTVSVSGATVQGKNEKYSWNHITKAFLFQSQNVYADFNEHFVNGEQIIIENAIYGSAPNSNLSGTTDVSATG